MSCVRCGGFVIRERLFDKNHMDAAENGDAERCLNCGAIEDAVILANRLPSSIGDRPRHPRGLYRDHS